jgi:hypothetical protein
MWPALRNLFVFVTFRAFGLLIFLSSLWLYLLLKTLFSIFVPHIVQRTFLSNTNNWFSFLLVKNHVSMLWSRTGTVCAVQRSTYLQSGFFVVFPDSRHPLVSSGILGTHILWRLQSVCRQLPRFTLRHESSYYSGPQSYFIVFCSFIFNLTVAASLSK